VLINNKNVNFLTRLRQLWNWHVVLPQLMQELVQVVGDRHFVGSWVMRTGHILAHARQLFKGVEGGWVDVIDGVWRVVGHISFYLINCEITCLIGRARLDAKALRTIPHH
jgi:hypothetical protein